MIEIKDLDFAFPGKQVFSGFSCILPERGTIIVRGPSGAGKTTFLRLLSGLLVPDGGTVTGLSNRKIGWVFQENRLLPWYTVQKNVELVSDKDTATEMLRTLELEESAESLPGDLSGGMARRVAIARAAAFRPEVWILDEPFTGLDERLKRVCASLIRSSGRPVFLVSHDEGDYDLFEDRTYVDIA